MKFPLQHKKTVYAIVLQTGLCLAGSGLFYPLSAIAEEPDASQTTAHVKPRLFVLTDIGDDPDDQMSMVRLMTYANRIDIEGLVATSTGKNKDLTCSPLINTPRC